MIDFDPSRHVYKKWVKMRNKMHFITFCVWYILLYFVFCHILCILFNFKLQAKLLNFIFIEVMWKLNYLRWLNFVQEKWLRRHFFMSPCNFFFFFKGCGDQRYPKKCESQVEVSCRIIRTWFQEHLQFSWLIRHCWSPKMTNFWSSK